MDLHRILSLLLTLEAAGKLEGRSLPELYDPNGDITLTVRATDVATREQFLADVAGTVDEAGPDYAEDAFVRGSAGSVDPVVILPRPAAPQKTAKKSAANKASKK